MTGSISEFARLEEEYEEAMATVNNNRCPKGQKEAALAEARRIGKILGYNTRPYNGYSG